MMVNSCARPLYFINEDPEFPYSRVGTCFVVRCSGKLWGITANHVAKLSNYNIDRAVIPCAVNSPEFFPVHRQHIYRPVDGVPEVTDVVIYEFDMGQMSGVGTPESEIYDLDAESLPHVGVRAQLWVHAFPDEINSICYDTKSMKRQSVIIPLLDPAESEDLEGCIQAKLTSRLNLASTRGLSGSPVIGVQELSSGIQITQLSGMVIRAGNGIVNFLGRPAITSLMRKALAA